MKNKKNTIRISTTVHADPKTVWNCYNTPNDIMQWNFASTDWACPSALTELRPGGKHLVRMEAKDGSFGFDFEAIYDEVVPGQRIAYTILDGREVTTEFEQLPEGTQVTTVFDAENEHPLDAQEAGWQAILDNFKRYVEHKTQHHGEATDSQSDHPNPETGI